MPRLIILLLLPAIAFSQYWGERVSEKSFEQSDLHFESYYLNSYGIYNFKDVARGLFADTFTKQYLNPAFIPADSSSRSQLYFDFRGDRSEPEVTNFAVPLPYYDAAYSYYIPPIDPRWFNTTRSEPEPIFSIGLSRYFQDRLFLSGTYQMMYKEEPYYQTPTNIYNSRYGYDYSGRAMADENSVPVVDRYAGEDQMLTKAHLVSFNTAYRLSEKIALGAGMNSVIHERNGLYGNLRTDQYSSSDDNDSYNSYLTDRRQDYTHIDLNAGIRYHHSDRLQFGLKLGFLDGEVNQGLEKSDSSYYYYDYSSNNYSSSHQSNRSSRTAQDWLHDGHNKYGTIEFDYRLNPKRKISFYYSYTRKEIDLSSNSFIRDTSDYSGEWQHNDEQSQYSSWYFLQDSRNASGEQQQKKHEAMLSFHWQESPKTSVSFGLHFAQKQIDTDTDEPVIFNSRSFYENRYDITGNNEINQSNYSRQEIKNLKWHYRSQVQTVQIPVLVQYRFADNWSVMATVNRIWELWEITDQTTAYFSKRDENNNGEITSETNFGERYTQPEQSISENRTDFMAGINVQISPSFKINLLVDPEIEPNWHVAQWWLGFRAAL